MSGLTIIPNELLMLDLKPLELRVMIALFSFRGKNTNVVWPSLDALSERANISDKTTISKITSSLVKKGLLTKKKRGFTGCNQYEITMPDDEEKTPNLDKSSKLDKTTTSNLDKLSNSNLDKSSKYKEQTNEQTNEQTIVIREAKKTKRFIPPSIDEIQEYINEKGLTINAEKFFYYYEANGWMVGKSKMKNWQAATHTWQNNNFERSNKNEKTKRGYIEQQIINAIPDGIIDF